MAAKKPIIVVKDLILDPGCRLSTSERLAALSVAEHMDYVDADGAFPKVETIAKETGLGVTTTRNALRRLCGPEGLFDRVPMRRGGANTGRYEYRLRDWERAEYEELVEAGLAANAAGRKRKGTATGSSCRDTGESCRDYRQILPPLPADSANPSKEEPTPLTNPGNQPREPGAPPAAARPVCSLTEPESIDQDQTDPPVCSTDGEDTWGATPDPEQVALDVQQLRRELRLNARRSRSTFRALGQAEAG